MGLAIGIDLGTTNSVVGVRKLSTQILPNAEGEELTPSCVALKRSGLLENNEEFIVGRTARDFLLQDPASTIVSIKRLMGRNFQDPEVQRLIQERRYAYEVSPMTEGTENSVAVRLGGKQYTPEEISSKVLAKLKTDAELCLGAVECAVVTVPAYFNDKQKHATRVATQLAGLKLQRLLPEPTAAAIAFGVDDIEKEDSKTILVYDFGGGTFDLSVLTIAGGHFIEQGKGGDMWLGGDDIDRLLVDFIYRKTGEEVGVGNIAELVAALPSAERNRFTGEIKRKAEQAKIELSSKDRAYVEVLGILRDKRGSIIDLDVEILRSDFETLIAPFVKRSTDLALKVLKEINFDPSLLDQVLLVGGSSTIPLVQRKVREIFGEAKVLVHPRPMLAIAEGAAILAHRLSGETEASMGEIVHTTSHDYYLQLVGGEQHLLVPRNATLPFRTESTFRFVDKDQKLAHFRFSNLVNDAFEPIGDLWLSYDDSDSDESEERGKEEPAEVILTFDIDENNVIQAGARMKDRPTVEITRALSRGEVDEKLYCDLERGIATVNGEGHFRYAAVDYLRGTIRIAGEINKVIDPTSRQVNESQVAQVRRLQATADELIKRDLATWCRIHYAEALTRNFAFLLKSKDVNAIHSATTRAATAVTAGESADDISDALEGMSRVVEKHGKIATVLTDIQNAAMIAEKTDPPQGFVLKGCIGRIIGSAESGDMDAVRAAMAEAMPIASSIHAAYGQKKFEIHKDVMRIPT